MLLSARRVGPTGKVYGLDMTDEMLAVAGENKLKSGLENVEFLKGEIEHGLAHVQLCQCRRIAAPERGSQCQVRHFAFLGRVVEM